MNLAEIQKSQARTFARFPPQPQTKALELLKLPEEH